ncbi:MAG: hypothetical protein GY805_14570 [Chloroflexi bacterium]|nr:hypothetical protein [Chloroflexota bacterium]
MRLWLRPLSPQCLSGNHQFQPSFTHCGSFIKFVTSQYADVNLVRLPETIDFETAAFLGYYFIIPFQAIVM